MAKNQIIKTVKGKYAGECPACNLVRGDWEINGTACGRCGTTLQTEAVPLTLDGEIKEETDEVVEKTLSKEVE